MRRIPIGIVAALGAAAWLACVGDDPVTSGPVVGDRLGACFPDGTCKQGLECRQPEKICLSPGEPIPADAGVDASKGAADASGGDGATSGDASSGDASSADGGGCVAHAETTAGIRCGTTKCTPTQGCCASATTLACNTTTTCTQQSGNFYTCDGTASCGGGGLRCCLAQTRNAPLGEATACTSTIAASSTTCMQQACTTDQRTLCNSPTECPSQNCVPTEVALDPSGTHRLVWGICAP